MENIALNGYPVKGIQAAAGTTCGTARFTIGRESVNRLDPDGRPEITLVSIDSTVGGRTVAGMKIDVEGFRDRRASRMRAGAVRPSDQVDPT